MGLGAAVVGAAAIGGVASVAGSSMQAGAAGKAASAQSAAADRATIAQEQQNAQTRGDLDAYQRLGTDTLGQLTPQIATYANPQQGSTSGAALLNQAYAENPGVYLAGTIPGQTTQANGQYVPNQTTTTGQGFSQAELEATPGYQFAKSQGLQATQNSAAARGLGVSGAALKGAATFATGLADNTYGAQFTRAMQQQQQDFGQQQNVFADQTAQQQQAFGQGQNIFSDQAAQNAQQFGQAQQRFTNLGALNSAQQGNATNSYNRLLGLATLGQNSAVQTGSIGSQNTNAAGNFGTQAGNALAGGALAQGNALAGGINGISNAFGQYANNQLLNGSANGGGSGLFGSGGSFSGAGGNFNAEGPGFTVPSGRFASDF